MAVLLLVHCTYYTCMYAIRNVHYKTQSTRFGVQILNFHVGGITNNIQTNFRVSHFMFTSFGGVLTDMFIRENLTKIILIDTPINRLTARLLSHSF